MAPQAPVPAAVPELVSFEQVQPGTFAIIIAGRECVRIEDDGCWKPECIAEFEAAVQEVGRRARQAERDRLIAMLDAYGEGVVLDLRKALRPPPVPGHR